MMRRVLILTTYDHIYAYAVSNLLRKHKSIEIIQRTLSNEASITKLAAELRPTVLIVNQRLFSEHAAAIVEAMTTVPEIKLFILNEKNNLIQIVIQKLVPISSGDDLVNEILIEGRPLLVEA
jgi:hypothetical protein